MIGHKPFLTAPEKAALEQRIADAEASTRAEIMTVIAQQSDGYRYIPVLWAALFALSVPGLYFLYSTLANDGWIYPGTENPAIIYPIQVLAFFGLGMLFQLPAARLWMIPNVVKQQRAARHAREQFFLQNLHQTVDHTGVLIFVSVAEHYVEIIVDSGISEKVDNQEWQESVHAFIEDVRRGDIAGGFDRAIDHCERVLSEHFPADTTRTANQNELPNHLIEV